MLPAYREERENEREREREKDEEAQKQKAQELDIIVAREEVSFSTSLKPLKEKTKQRKTFHSCQITEEEDEEGSLKDDKRTKHLHDCCHQGYGF